MTRKTIRIKLSKRLFNMRIAGIAFRDGHVLVHRATHENFFAFEDRKWHEIGVYYLMQMPNQFPFQPEEIVHRVRDAKNDLEFKWVPADKARLEALPLQPDFIPARIADLPQTSEHLIHRESVPE